ncbi:MAG: hypothetical protein WCV72_02805 [Patescibacteria group bacterium]|jgi:peptidoglycan hydrolase CwlO-like protein
MAETAEKSRGHEIDWKRVARDGIAALLGALAVLVAADNAHGGAEGDFSKVKTQLKQALSASEAEAATLDDEAEEHKAKADAAQKEIDESKKRSEENRRKMREIVEKIKAQMEAEKK